VRPVRNARPEESDARIEGSSALRNETFMTILLQRKNNASEESVLEGAAESRLSFRVIPKKRTAWGLSRFLCQQKWDCPLCRHHVSPADYLTHSLRVFKARTFTFVVAGFAG
jgi:hypothetical protein